MEKKIFIRVSAAANMDISVACSCTVSIDCLITFLHLLRSMFLYGKNKLSYSSTHGSKNEILGHKFSLSF